MPVNQQLAKWLIDPHAIILDYEGMQLQREFYTPVYDREVLKSSILPDFRNVLYWSPNIPIDEKRNGKINFYTSDLSGLILALYRRLMFKEFQEYVISILMSNSMYVADSVTKIAEKRMYSAKVTTYLRFLR